jgi:hypothetical protein
MGGARYGGTGVELLELRERSWSVRLRAVSLVVESLARAEYTEQALGAMGRLYHRAGYDRSRILTRWPAVQVMATVRGIGLKVLTGQGAAIDTTTAAGKLVFGIFAALAEFERELISERTIAAWPRRAHGDGPGAGRSR